MRAGRLAGPLATLDGHVPDPGCRTCRMKAVFTDLHKGHDPKRFILRGKFAPGEERPERAERLMAGLKAGHHELVAAESFGQGPRLGVHSVDYLRFLEEAAAEWQTLADASDEVLGNVHPVRRQGTLPQSITGRAGWYMQDMACGIGPHTWTAAAAATDVAITAAELVIEGERAAYALCRPPGHHAYRDMAGGHCFLNNTAIAAQYLRSVHDRVAILDIDIHHGNGTQAIFYDRPDVLTVSVHADPARFYPFFWGYAHERGEGAGEGCNLNLPIPVGSGDEAYVAAVEAAAPTIGAFAPGILVVALGLDASADDPFGGAKVTEAGFRCVGAAIARLGLPTLFVQEGGYLSDRLGSNLTAVLGGFEAAA
jgi:acetoin utilization deacetylase AcuC-like enzyme